MNKCIDCINETICKGNRRKGSHAHCFQPKVKDYPPYLDNPKPTRKQTNFERIRNMSIEEFVEFINKNYKCRKCAYYNKCCDSNCESGIKLWLESEASDE